METRILYKKIADELIGKIERGDLRPGDRVPSEKQMAELYHVSVITTKNAMNTLADRGILVRERGRGTFIAAAEDIARIKEIQLPQTFLGALKLVGVIIPSMKTAIDQQLLDRIEYELSQRGYTIVLRITRESQQYESAAIRELIAQNVRGLIIFPVENEIYNEDILKLTVEHYPFVFVDRYLKGIRANSVVTDNLEITRKAVDYLLEKGCRHIVFVSPGNKNSVTDDRLSGFTQALSSYGLPVGSDNLCMLPQELTEPEEKFEWIDGYARKYPAADAYFCVNQEMSSYIKRISDQRGALNCELFSFDFAESANFNCVIQDVPAIAKACIEVLERAMNGSKEIINRIVPAKLVLTANASRHLDA